VRFLVLSLCALATLLQGCRADPPAVSDGSGIPPVQGPYPSLAICTPPTPCPGSACATRAIGKADGQTVDMAVCELLQLTFTTGTIVPKVGQADLAFDVASVAGVTRIEASKPGEPYQTIGFLCGQFCSRPAECLAQQSQGRLLLDVTRCNYTLSDFNVLRLVREPGSSGGVVLDAVEALQYKEINQP